MQDCCYVVERYEPIYDPYYERAVYCVTTSHYNNIRPFSTDVRYSSPSSTNRPSSTNVRYSSQYKQNVAYKHYDDSASHYSAPMHTHNYCTKYLKSHNNPTTNFRNTIPQNSDCRPNMQTAEHVQSPYAEFDYNEDDFTPLRCWECNVNFTSKHYLYKHLFHHIKQPYIVLERTQLPSLKITLKSKSDNSFEIISSPTYSANSDTLNSPLSNGNISESIVDHLIANLADKGNSRESPEEGDFNLSEEQEDKLLDDSSDPLGITLTEQEADSTPSFSGIDDFTSGGDQGPLIEAPITPTSDSLGGGDKSLSPLSNSQSATNTNILNSNSNSAESNVSEYGSIPGAEPTPPPDPSPDYPKIRIKTTGLLKEPEEGLTITEITDDNPDGDPNFRGFFSDRSNSNNSMWTTPSLEDPLKLPDNDDNILSLFNNNDRAKDLGFHSSDSEYISLDKLEDRNRGAMQLYNPQQNNQSSLDSLTGLPMQALAQQVSRLQPSGGNGLHQQNVLINIQQFPSGPPQPAYQPPPMYPHYPPQPMHQPYQYQPPNPMYYPPQPPGYPPQHMPPPPQPQMPQQMGHQPPVSQPMSGAPSICQPPMQNNQMSQSNQPQNGPMGQSLSQQPPQQGAGGYRQPMSAPRQVGPRPTAPGTKMPNGPRPPMGQRQPMARQRAPMVRARVPGPGMTAVRTVRPRMTNPPNGIRPQNSPVKRSPEQTQQIQAKKKKFDLLTPDKDDDDCQVICMQPKNTDGGLPQIESVQGGTSEPTESSIMHLSESITLSVRNPPPKPVEPKKSDAKAVANILATRGITVTATAKPKEKPESPQKSPTALSTPLNLNGAVSIIPASKSNGNSKGSNEALPTVDLTDDTTPSSQTNNTASKQRPGLPFRCDLCPAQYPNSVGLKNHRQTYHKTNGGICELGIPLINMKTPGIMQKLSSIGINNYIPVPSSEGSFALPIISTRNPGNVSAMGATQMLSLGPVRAIPKPQNTANIAAKQLNTKT